MSSLEGMDLKQEQWPKLKNWVSESEVKITCNWVQNLVEKWMLWEKWANALNARLAWVNDSDLIWEGNRAKDVVTQIFADATDQASIVKKWINLNQVW